MRSFCLALMLLALAAAGNPAAATSHLGAAGDHGGRLGLLPPSWVEALERNNVSERTAVAAGGATAAAIGIGAVAGVAAGGATGATLFALWLAHWPLQIALMGGGGYLAGSYLCPTEPPGGSAAPAQAQPSIQIGF